jgi:hypothetical protein
MRELYQGVLERLLLALADDPEESIVKQPVVLLEGNRASESVWPPWPWPPWGGDDDGDDEDTRDPIEKAHDLAEGVLKFESLIANASLDLYVLFYFVLQPSIIPLLAEIYCIKIPLRPTILALSATLQMLSMKSISPNTSPDSPLDRFPSRSSSRIPPSLVLYPRSSMTHPQTLLRLTW